MIYISLTAIFSHQIITILADTFEITRIFVKLKIKTGGVPIYTKAEIIPFEPDAGNAAAGNL